MESDSEYISKGPCDACGSSDANATYSDGHTWCFSCNAYEGGDDVETGKETISNDGRVSRVDGGGGNSVLLRDLRFVGWSSRGLDAVTCRKWGIGIGTLGSDTVRVFNYRDKTGELVAQKTRTAKKDMKFLGKNQELYGRWLWRDKGKRIVITEGEIDAASISQAQGHKWPVVSVPNGASGAKKSIQKNLEWLMGFEEVVLCFDNDEAGRKAAKQCAVLFRPGQCKIATLALKDANEELQAGNAKGLINAIWDAAAYRPDGILDGTSLWATVSAPFEVDGFKYPWPSLQDKTLGIRKGEITTFTSGSGMGKTAFLREIGYSLSVVQGLPVGNLFLEENVRRTALGYMSLAMDQPLHLMNNPHELEGFEDAYKQTVGSGRLYFYDHFGSTSLDNVLDRIRYLAVGCGCEFVMLDHLSILVSGIGEGDERRLIDNAMTALRTLVEELQIGLVLVSHLKRTEGPKGHEDGAQVRLGQLRGSGAIGQLSDVVIGLERDQQSEDRHRTTIRVVKSRLVGDTGPAGIVLFDPETGRLKEESGFEADY